MYAEAKRFWSFMVWGVEKVKILRDLRLSTKLLILIEITVNPRIKLKPIAEKLDITVQAVSEYLKRMHEEGLVQTRGGEYKATRKGVQFLHDSILELNEFLDNAMKSLNIIDVCAAIAKTPIKKGNKVGLLMEKGVLAAYANRPSKSTGVALMDAEVGEDVAVGELEGIVDLSPGRLLIVRIPSIREGGTRGVSIGKVREIYSGFKPDKVGAMDPVALSLVERLGVRCDFVFAPINATIEAIQKGLNVMVFASREDADKLASMVDEVNLSSLEKIEYELISP